MADEGHDHDRGLAFDLETMGRRRALAVIGGGVLVALAACGGNGGEGTEPAGQDGSGPGDGSASGSGEGCDVIPEETAGPYPGDGSNGPDALSEDGVVRSDIRSSFGSSSATAEGVPLTITLALQDANGDCGALAGAAVYVWHCDREGRYSMYSQGVEDENYLRGVQEADANGRVTFRSVFPGAYSGRWPHIHFEVYESLAAATGDGTRWATSQVALPEAACDAIYTTEGYQDSVRNMERTSLANDNVFGGDESAAQLGTTSGDARSGYSVELAVPVDRTAVSTGGAGGPGGGPGGPGGPPPGR